MTVASAHIGGVVISGQLSLRYAAGEETYRAGDVYAARPGHVPVVTAGTEVIEFSPTDKLAETCRVAANMADARRLTVISTSDEVLGREWLRSSSCSWRRACLPKACSPRTHFVIHDAAVASPVPRRRGHRGGPQGRSSGPGSCASLSLRRDGDGFRFGGGRGVGPRRRVVVLPGTVSGRCGRRCHLRMSVHRTGDWDRAVSGASRARRSSCCARSA